MKLMDYFSVGVLAVLFFLLVLQIGHQRWRLDFFFWTKAIFISSIIGVAVYYAYLVYNQYFEWFAAGPPTIYLLPPYEGVGYVFFYHFSRFGLPLLISLFCAGIFLAAANWHNRRHQGKFFEKEEPYLGALAIFLAGTPGELYYFGSIVLIYFFLHLGLRIVRSSEKEFRLPLYWLWLPPAILVIISRIFF